MDHLAVGGGIVLLWCILDFPIKTALDDISGTSGAVVIEVVVSVDAVFWLQVVCQCLLELQLLLVCQIQYLLGDAAAPFLLVGTEVIERCGGQFVISQPKHKPQYKEWLVEAEAAPVEGPVLSCTQIMIANGRMAVKTVNLLMR